MKKAKVAVVILAFIWLGAVLVSFICVFIGDVSHWWYCNSKIDNILSILILVPGSILAILVYSLFFVSSLIWACKTPNKGDKPD